MINNTAKYKYWDDQRSQKQVILTNLLVEKQSDLNLKQIQNRQFQLKTQNILTICINGYSTYNQIFQQYQFPGKMVVYTPPAFQTSGTPEFYMKRLNDVSPVKIANEIQQIVKQYSQQVILVYHSFGSFIATIYCHYFPQRVVGIVEFSTLSITYPPKAKATILKFQNIPIEDMILHIDEYSRNFEQNMKQQKNPMGALSNKYQITANNIIRKITAEYFYQWRRQLPNVLKLFIIGRNDKLMEHRQLNELLAYYAYKPKQNTQYFNRLAKKYQQLTGIQTDNIQQKFIFSLNQAGHIVHVSKKQQCQRLMNLYFQILFTDQPKSSL